METILRVKERPILFSGQMVAAILAGNKTQTRRVITERYQACLSPEDEPEAFLEFCPYGQVGDRLWVRETWAALHPGKDIVLDNVKHQPGVCTLAFRATETRGIIGNWRPSIFMPRWASRLTLELTEVRAERLNDISIEDVLAEGIEKDMTDSQYWRENTGNRFTSLWDSINGKRGYAWNSNPFVWALTFRRAEEP